MLTRRKRLSIVASPQSTSKKSRTESASPIKDKKSKNSNEVPKNPIENHTSRTRNRSQNVSGSQIQRHSKRNSETAPEDKSKKIKLSHKDQNDEDDMKTYCWICHKPCENHICACGRVYHHYCLVETSQTFSKKKCPECKLKSVDGTELVRPFADGLKVYLECVANWIKEKYMDGAFLSWPQHPLNEQVRPVMDINTLIKKIQNDVYKTTAEFYADAKWIYHNSCVCYGEKSKEAAEAKKLVKDVKEELMDMEACPECYYYLFCKLFITGDSIEDEKTKSLNYEKSFVRLCDPPHEIVWAKVSGHSYWPAKVLKILNGKAHVRFFGKHEKYDVLISTIFHISERHPSFDSRNITSAETRTTVEYTYAKNELLKYKALYESAIGEFKFFGYRSLYKEKSKHNQKQQAPKNETAQVRKSSKRIVPKTCEVRLESLPHSIFTTVDPTRSAPTDKPIKHSKTSLPSQHSEDISVSMTFSVDNSSSDDNTANIDSTLVDIASSMNCSETHQPDQERIEGPSVERCALFNDRSNDSSVTMYPTLLESNLNSSPTSTETSSEVHIKEEVSTSSEISQTTLPGNEPQTSSLFMQILRNAINTQSNTGDNNARETFLTNVLQNCVSDSGNSVFSAASVVIKEEEIVCSTNSVQSTSGEHLSEDRSNVDRDILLSTESNIVPCTSNNEILLIDLTNDESNVPMELSNLLVENPEIRDLFKNAHQSLHTLLTRLCVETCKRQRTESHQRCEAFNAKLNETEKRFHEETEKLRDEIKCLQMSLAAEKKKNDTSTS